MMRLVGASMIAPLPLLTWAATASAERAWVLWGRANSSTKGSARTFVVGR